MEEAGRAYRQMLIQYISDRAPLAEAGTAVQWLPIRFSERVVIGWRWILETEKEPRQNEQAEFALALWKDMNFPLPESKSERGTDIRWIERYLSAARKKYAPEE